MHKQSESVQAFNARTEEGEQLGVVGMLFYRFRLSTFNFPKGNWEF